MSDRSYFECSKCGQVHHFTGDGKIEEFFRVMKMVRMKCHTCGERLVPKPHK